MAFLPAKYFSGFNSGPGNIPRKQLVVALCMLATSCSDTRVNPCIDEYPNKAGEILTSPGGTIERIEPVEWFEDGVYRITVESGGIFMTRPEGLPMPSVGAELEFRVYSKTKESIPFAGCYCQIGTGICVEEYTYP